MTRVANKLVSPDKRGVDDERRAARAKEEAQGAQSLKKNSCREKCYQMEQIQQKTCLKCMIFTDKPYFNCSEYKI